MEKWSEWFISKVREDLRDRVTTLDEIWGIIIFSPEKQSVAEAAARVAEEILQEKDRVISELEEESNETHQELIRRRERIDELTKEVHHLKEELLKLKTPISDNI